MLLPTYGVFASGGGADQIFAKELRGRNIVTAGIAEDIAAVVSFLAGPDAAGTGRRCAAAS